VNNFFAQQEIKGTTIFPMVRARLVSKNDQLIKTAEWEDERCKTPGRARVQSVMDR